MTAITVGGTNAAGLRWPNYVNGRLLTAQDLEATQSAVFTRDRWLGAAIGAGTVTGLMVSGASRGPALRVTAGVGINREGTALRLEHDATLDLAVVEQLAAPDGSRFADCRPPGITTRAPTAGPYLLTVCPQTWFDGKVPVQGREGALPTPCVSRWEVEGVVFKAIRLDRFTAATTAENRRNLLAHWCFGSSRLGPIAMDGFTSTAPHRGIEQLAPPDLLPCDLPLAVFDWDGTALNFVDVWSARRRPVRPAATVTLAKVVGDDRAADGEARFLQFQEQVASVLAQPFGEKTTANSVFPLLPPAGLLPVNSFATAELLKTKFDAHGHRTRARVVTAAPATATAATAEVTAAYATAGWETALKPAEAGYFGAFEANPGTFGLVATEFAKVQTEIETLKQTVQQLQDAVGASRGGAATPLVKQRRAERILRLVELVALNGADGFDPVAFFEGIDVRFGVVGPETVDFTIRRSWCDEPVRVGGSPTLNVYFIVDDDDWKRVAPYVLFAKHIRGARWITASEPLPIPG